MPTVNPKTAKPGEGLRDLADENSSADFEAELRQLREELAALTRQVTTLGGRSLGTAKRAAAQGAEQLRVQGEAALESVRDNARDMEQQLVATVREKPVTALAVAAGIGYLLAMMSRR